LFDTSDRIVETLILAGFSHKAKTISREVPPDRCRRGGQRKRKGMRRAKRSTDAVGGSL